MSYILEALKKSQQERELGQVPTLDASGLFVEDKEPVPTNYWAFLSVALAALAVVIALYAALRGGQEPPGVPATVAATPSPQTADPSVDTARAGAVRPAAEPPSGIALPPRAPAMPSAPALVEAPPPKRLPRPVPAAPTQTSRADGADTAPALYDAPVSLDLDPLTEEELLRQLQAEQAALSGQPAPGGQSALGETAPLIEEAPRPATIPSDLVKDIEAFKQQVRREQGVAPSAAKRPSAKIKGDPTRLRLTAEQRAMLPAYLMTVHVYDANADKRFVVINGMTYREADETREGLRVEQILKDGAVLSYLGNPFYVAR
ncbi:general secretion pathway protein GspB [Thiocystis violacea]|uniref:general secretion pathway protein GspB n=1 Tax=Thiocystis violacea TaxID=13725 RepID=UPI0019070AE5|nr:general secretion pathway protein GspB [Thiocystis violacea]MBK1722188.1 hypothetical protein [Thiocystis violacea]